MFADGRGRDSRQIWNLPPVSKEQKERVNGLVISRYCFKKVLWSPGGTQGGNQILINKSHKNTNCFSSIVCEYTAQLKAYLHIPYRPRPSYLRKQCEEQGVELIVSAFHGAQKDSAFQEQALVVSRTDIMIGIHGAGLNMFHLMPFNSALFTNEHTQFCEPCEGRKIHY